MAADRQNLLRVMPAEGAMSTQHLDAVIVGGGIIGLSIAHRATARGMAVAVLEAGDPGGGATNVAAGMLAPVTEASFGEEALLEAALESLRRWPAFAAELGVPLLGRGALMVARDRDEAEALERELAFRAELGLPVQRLRPSEARRREPALAPTVRLAAEAPGDDAVDPRAVAAALRAAVGPVLRTDCRVTAVEPGAGAVLESGERVAARAVVLAAGAWSGGVDGVPAGAAVPVRPVKGQLLRLRDPGGPGLVGRVLRMGPGYLVPRPDGRYILGATVEELGFDETVTAGAVWELLRDAIEVVPGLAELELEGALAGLRPGTPDNAPAIGPAPGAPGLIWAAGHHRNGVLLAPLTADAVVAELAGESPPPGIAGLAPARFAGASAAVTSAKREAVV